jgi:hypothetical protein
MKLFPRGSAPSTPSNLITQRGFLDWGNKGTFRPKENTMSYAVNIHLMGAASTAATVQAAIDRLSKRISDLSALQATGLNCRSEIERQVEARSSLVRALTKEISNG